MFDEDIDDIDYWYPEWYDDLLDEIEPPEFIGESHEQ